MNNNKCKKNYTNRACLAFPLVILIPTLLIVFIFSLFLYFHFLKNLYLSLSLSWAWIPRDLQKIKAPGCRALEWEAEKSFKKTQKWLRIKS